MTIAIRTLAANLAEKAWAMTDAPVDATLYRKTSGTYNPATGKVASGNESSYPVKAIIKEYTQNELKGTSILSTDRKCLLRQKEVVAAGEIATSDRIIISGKTMNIIDVGQDAVGALWILQIRG